MLAAHFRKLAVTSMMLLHVVIQEGFSLDDDDNELQCDIPNAISCYWNIADKFGKGHFLPVSKKREDYLRSFCQVTENSAVFPEDATCKDFYASCTDVQKSQFAKIEAGYAELQKDTTTTDVCQSVESLRWCLNLDVIRNCGLPSVSGIGTSFIRMTSRRRVAEKLRTCLKMSLKSCDPKKYGSAMAHLKRIADSIVDLNSPSILGAGVGGGCAGAGATAALIAVAVVSWLLSALC